jgi:hypothetical protein
MGVTRQGSSRGGIQTQDTILASPNVEGPALGGLLLVPLVQKIAGTGGTVTMAQCGVLTASRLIAVVVHQAVGGTPGGMQTVIGGTAIYTNITGGNRIAHKEASGVTLTDIPWQVGLTPDEESLRSMNRNALLSFQEVGAGAVQLSCAVSAIVCTRGPVYDPTNAPGGAGGPYVSAKD